MSLIDWDVLNGARLPRRRLAKLALAASSMTVAAPFLAGCLPAQNDDDDDDDEGVGEEEDEDE